MFVRNSIAAKMFAPTAAFMVAGIIGTAIYASSLVHSTAIGQQTQAAEATVAQYRSLRGYYTRHVVAKAEANGLVATTEHENDPNAIPLPATMIHELSNEFVRQGLPVRLQLFSAHPFPQRSNRSLDDFQLAALAHLVAEPRSRYVAEQSIAGREYLRFAVADVMGDATCVSCHNSHPKSPKTDWALGDVRGVLEVSMSIDESIAAAAALRARILGIGLLSVAVALLATIPIVRRTNARVEATVNALEGVAKGDLEHVLSNPDGDRSELGRIAHALNTAVANTKAMVERLHYSHTLIDHAPVNFLTTDLDHVARYLSPAAVHALAALAPVLPVRPEQIVGALPTFLFETEAELRETLSRPEALPARRLRELGDQFLDVAIDPLLNSEGETIGALFTFENVTDKLRDQRVLQVAVNAEREAAESLRVAAEREKVIADRDRATIQTLRDQADQILKVVRSARSGDLTRTIGMPGDDPMSRVAIELDGMFEELRNRIVRLNQTSAHLSGSSNRLGTVSQNLLESAERTRSEAKSVTSAWSQTSDGIDRIADHVGGFRRSFQGISRNASAAVEVVAEAVSVADGARATIEDLSRATTRIASVLEGINDIADQSRLLALNASIEAARAGEAGRSFAIVATEVKQLASRTEDATREIRASVEDILARGERTSKSIREIGNVVAQIDEGQQGVARTVVDQQAASELVSESADQARAAAQLITSSISELTKVAEGTLADAKETDEAARSLLEASAQIREITRHFTC